MEIKPGTPRSEDDDLKMLADILVDPLLKRQFDKGAEANRYLASDTTIGDAEAARIIQTLDDSWPYYHESVRVSGMVVYVDPALGRMRQVSISDKTLISKGWTQENVVYLKNGAVLRPFEMPDDPPGVTLNEIDHMVRNVALVFEEPREDGSSGVYYARTNEIAMEFRGISDVHLSNTLHYHQPELMEQIDGLLEGARSAEERLERITSIELTVNSSSPDEEEFTDQLAAYLEMRLGVDTHLPYECVIDGPIDMVTGEGEDDRAVLNESGIFACLLSIDGLMAHIYDEYEDPETGQSPVGFEVQAHLHGDVDTEPIPITFSVDSLKKCRSMRTRYYTSTVAKLVKRYSEPVMRIGIEDESE